MQGFAPHDVLGCRVTDTSEGEGRGGGARTEVPELRALLSAFLEALCDPQGGGTLHGLHAGDAPVRHRQGIGPAADIDRDEFALRHRDISLAGGDRLPRFSDPAPLEATADPRGSETVAWFEVNDFRRNIPLLVVLGTRLVAGAHRIVWCTSARQRGQWSFRDGLLRSLADYPWMRATGPAVPRALLDAAWFRRFPAPVEFDALPDARFGCRMSTACCKHDFEITLPAEAQLLIDAMPWEALEPRLAGTRLPMRPDGKLQLKRLDETCRFLDSGGQCLIHRTLGRQPFGPCCVFPFSFARTPDGVAVGLSPVCGSARLGLGISPRERSQDLLERLAHADPRSTETYRLAPGSEIPWERFREIERVLCEYLAAGELPMRRRLYLGSRLLGALGTGEPIDVHAWMAQSPPTVTAELRAAIHGMLARIIGWDRSVLRRLPRRIPDLGTLEIRDAPSVAQILRNTLYCKVYSYPFDLTTAYNHLIVLYLLALIMQSAAGTVPEQMWRELGSLGVHGLLRSMLHEGMPEGFRSLLGTADFGLWMLGA